MKSIAYMLLLGCAGTGFAFGQSPNLGPSQPVPKPAPGFGGLFQVPTIPEGGKPQFKLQIPGNGLRGFTLPQLPLIVEPRQNAPAQADPGMVRRPKGFAQRQPRPAVPHNLYPDLKVLPIEMAQLETAANQSRFEAIPRVWPKARIEPIPITWEGYRMVPVTGAADGKTANK